MLAARKDRVDIVVLLLRAPGVPAAWVNAQARDGTTALMAASLKGASAVVEALVAAGADVHVATSTGQTALHFAFNADIARLLWSAGARDSLTVDNVNALVCACAKDKPDIVEFLLQQGLDANGTHPSRLPLIQAARLGHVDVLRALLAADPPAEVDRQDELGKTALLYAVENNHPEAVELLLAHGADIDVRLPHGFAKVIRSWWKSVAGCFPLVWERPS
jgi:ankyrin repeat protein